MLKEKETKINFGDTWPKIIKMMNFISIFHVVFLAFILAVFNQFYPKREDQYPFCGSTKTLHLHYSCFGTRNGIFPEAEH